MDEAPERGSDGILRSIRASTEFVRENQTTVFDRHGQALLIGLVAGFFLGRSSKSAVEID